MATQGRLAGLACSGPRLHAVVCGPLNEPYAAGDSEGGEEVESQAPLGVQGLLGFVPCTAALTPRK